MAYNVGTYIPAVPCQFFTDAGLPASGYKLFTYAGGTTTKLTTYTASDLSASNTNPITLDAAGRCTVFLSPLIGISWKFVLATPTTADPPAGGDIIWTRDNVQIVPNSEANIDILGTTVGAIPAGTCVILNSAGTWHPSDPANAQDSIDAPRVGFVVAAGTPAVIRLAGKVPNVPGVATGFTYYMSTTQGEVTNTPPTGAFHIVPVGFGDAATDLVFPINSMFRVGARLALKSFGYSAGQGNDATTGNTELTNYAVPIPGNILDQPGACLIVEGVCVIANTATNGDLKLRLDTSGTLATVFVTSGGVASQIVPFRIKIFRRSVTAGAYNGISHIGAASGGAPTNYLCNTATSGADWSTGQTLHVFAHSNTAADANKVVLTDYSVYAVRSYQGDTV